jgi:HEAT repeat protein
MSDENSSDLQGLLNTLKTSSAWEERRDAAEALGKLGDTSSVEALIDALQNDSKFPVRFRAAQALGQLGDERALAPLNQSLKNDREIKEYAASALAALGEKGIDLLIEALQNPDPQVCLYTCYALGGSGQQRAVEPLIALLNDPNHNAIASVAAALESLKDPRAIPPLAVAFSKAPQGDPRRLIARALDSLGWQPEEAERLDYWIEMHKYDLVAESGPEGIERLTTMLTVTETSMGAKAALTKVGKLEEVAAMLREKLKDGSHAERLRAAKALKGIDQLPKQEASLFIKPYETALQNFWRAKAAEWWKRQTSTRTRVCDSCNRPLVPQNSYYLIGSGKMKCAACADASLKSWDWSLDYFGKGEVETALSSVEVVETPVKEVPPATSDKVIPVSEPPKNDKKWWEVWKK